MKKILSVLSLLFFVSIINAQQPGSTLRTDTAGVNPGITDSTGMRKGSTKDKPAMRSDSTINKNRNEMPSRRDTLQMDDRKSKNKMSPDSTRLK